MKYIAPYDTNGNYRGFYPLDMLDLYTEIPTPNIELTEEQHTEAMTGDYKVVNGVHTYSPHVPTIAETQDAKWEQIKFERNRRETSGFTYQGKLIDSDQLSVQRISIAAQAAQVAKDAGQSFTLDWTTADNSVLTLDADGVIGMPLALAQYSDNLHQIARGLREQIYAATTIAEVEGIAWPT